MRYFIGVPIDVDLHKYKDMFKAEGITVNKYNHLTLHFYGQLDDAGKDNVIESLSTLKFPQFTIRLNKVSYFKAKGMVRVVYLGAGNDKDSKNMDELYQEAKKCLKFKDDRPFVTHLTLCRNKDKMNNEFIVKQIGKIKIDEEVDVNNVILYKSKLTKEGPVYEEVFVKQLMKKK